MKINQEIKNVRSLPERCKRKIKIPIVASIFFLFGILFAVSDIPKFLKANYVIFTTPESPASFFESNDLESIQIDIKMKYLLKIKSKRDQALSQGFLQSSDEDFVPANILLNGKNVECKMRLKGDLPDHWAGDKWSFRIKVSKGNKIFGMSRFSLQRPGTRQDTGQWLFLQSLRNENLLAVDYQFVNLTLNGKKLGIYALEQHFTKEMLESQKKREGVIVSFDEYRYWNKKHPEHSSFTANKMLQTSQLQSRNNNSIENSVLLSKQKVICYNLLRGFQEKKLLADQVFDPDTLGKFLALCRIWNAEHALFLHNINFYLNPITCRLEPIGYDGMPGVSTHAPFCYFTGGKSVIPWVNQALRSTKIANSYLTHLNNYSQKSYLKKLRTDLERDEVHLRRLLIRNLMFEEDDIIWSSNFLLHTPDLWRTLSERMQNIRNEMGEKRPVFVYAKPSSEEESTTEVSLRNAVTQPVEILGFQINNSFHQAKDCIGTDQKISAQSLNGKIIIPPQDFESNALQEDYLFTINSDSDSNRISPSEKRVQPVLLARMLGKKEIIKIPFPVDKHIFKKSLLPFFDPPPDPITVFEFIEIKGGQYFVRPGDHNVSHDLKIPSNQTLIISEGTILRFSEKAMLISQSPIQAIGSEKNPIVFKAQKSSWPGMFISNAKKFSRLEHVSIKGTRGVGEEGDLNGINRGGWFLTGGTTFYKSPVDITNCKIEHSLAEDSLNIISARFNIHNSTFTHNKSDGFDGDFVDGNISDCSFSNIGGDGIDLSGSDVLIKNTKVINTSDKALSVGEGSHAETQNCFFEDVDFGIASKDLSKVKSFGTRINRARVAGFAAFQKKDTFGPSMIYTKDHAITHTKNKFLVQDGSNINADGKIIPPQSFDTQQLYK